jgi:hypothetical protein
MRFNGKFSAAALGVLIVTLAGPAFAGEKGGDKNFAEIKKVEMKKSPAVDSGLGKTNSGGTAACPVYIACVVNGVIVNGPAAEACNGGRAQPVQQCQSKAKL